MSTNPSIDSPVSEIRIRALRSLRSKLEKGLLSVEELFENESLSRLIRCWFLGGVLPGSHLALSLLRELLSSFPELRQPAGDLGLRSILSRWRLSIHDKELLEILSDILGGSLLPVEENGKLGEEGSLSSSQEEEESQLCASKSLLPLLSLPSHLLLPSQSPGGEQPSTYSPVRRHYFKKVHFSSRQPSGLQTNTPPTFPWISLKPRDIEALKPNEDASYNPQASLEVISTFTHALLHDFPPQVFLQRPYILKTIFNVLQTSEDTSLRSDILQAFSLYLRKINGKCRHQEGLYFRSMTATSIPVVIEEDISECGSDNSLNDRIRALELKKEQWTLCDFVWDLFEVSLGLWSPLPQNEEGSLRLINALYVLQLRLLTLLTEMGVNMEAKEGGRVNELGITLADLSNFHRSKMSLRVHRLAYLLLVRLNIKWMCLCASLRTHVPDSLKEYWREVLYDHTMHLSQPGMHAELCSLLDVDFADSLAKPLLQSIRHTVVFLKSGGVSLKDSIHAAGHAVPSFPLHESQLFLSKFFKLCSDSGDEDLHGPLIQLLKIRNINLKTQIYLSLHALVQSTLGISHALNRFDPVAKFKFLVRSPRVFEMVLRTSLSPTSPPSLKMACEEVILYLLKSERILRPIWEPVINSVVLPNIIFFECLASTEDRLGRLILDAFNPDADLRTFTGLTKKQILISNFRLLFHTCASLREAAQGNLKVILAQEENSCLKLPRFADIFEADVSSDFTKGEEEVLNFRGIAVSNQQSIGEFISLMESFLFSDEASSQELRRSLSRLTILMEDNVIHSKFVECGGFDKVMQVWGRVLTENDYVCGLEILPSLLGSVKTILLKNEAPLTSKLLLDSRMLLYLLRSMFILKNNAAPKRDVSVIAALLLFKDPLSLEGGVLKMDPIIATKFVLPFHFEKMEEEKSSIEEHPEDMKCFKLLKVYWGICFEGLAFLCSSLPPPEVNIHFDNRLILQPEERDIISTSFPEENLSNPVKLLRAQTPSAFLRELEYLIALRHIHGNSDKPLPMRYDKVFKRFLTLEPRGEQDLLVYIRILTYLMDHQAKDSPNVRHWANKLLQSDDTMYKLLLRESRKEGHINRLAVAALSRFLVLFEAPKSEAFIQGGLLLKEERSSLFWLFHLLKSQVEGLTLLESCDVSKYICDCIGRQGMGGDYYGCGPLLPMLQTLQRIVEKTRMDKDFESLEVFGTPSWILPLLTHKSVLIRTLIFQITSLVAISDLGADSLIRRLSDSVSIWEIGLSTFMNEGEALLVREGALKTLSNLLDGTHNLFYGPTIREEVSGVLIKGQSALTSFLRRSQFDEFVIDVSKNFGAAHGVRLGEETESSLEDATTMTPLFMGGVLYFLLQSPDTGESLLKAINSCTEIDISDGGLSGAISNFDLTDYVFYLDTLICLQLKQRNFLASEGISVLNTHLASTLFLRRRLKKSEALSHLTKNLFRWLHRMLNESFDDGDLRKLMRILTKYEEGILKATQELLLDHEGAILNWITVYMDFVYAQRDPDDHDDCSALKREIGSALVRHFHEALQKNEVKILLQCTYALSSLSVHRGIISPSLGRKLIRSILDTLERQPKDQHTRSLIVLLNNLCHLSQEFKNIALKDAHFSDTLLHCIQSVPQTTLTLLRTLAFSPDPSFLFRAPKLFNKILSTATSSRESFFREEALRIFISLSANSNEVRSLLYKSSFLTGETSPRASSSPALLQALDPKRKCSKKRSEELILTMDLLLTVTSFSDGQIYVASKAPGVMDYLLLSLLTNKFDILPLAILRNISFHPSNRARLLLCKDFLSVLRDIFLYADSGESALQVEIAMQIVWSVCHNSLKAKGTLREAGVLSSLKELLLVPKESSALNPALCSNLNEVLFCDSNSK